MDHAIATHFGGDPARHLTENQLRAALLALPAPPRTRGVVRAVVLRPNQGTRSCPPSVVLVAGAGVAGDCWEHGARKPAAAVSVMRDDVARLIANGQDPALGGDNLRIDLDLDERHLPVGTHLQVGGALCRVSPKLHTGCRRFAARFGRPARELPRTSTWLPHRLRGLFLEVAQQGFDFSRAKIARINAHNCARGLRNNSRTED